MTYDREMRARINDDAVELVRRVRRLAVDLDDQTLDGSAGDMMDAMRADLRGNCFMVDDSLDVVIHDIIWLINAARSHDEAKHLCYTLLAKVQIFAMNHGYIDVSRFKYHEEMS